jgi:hypothetical protein
VGKKLRVELSFNYVEPTTSTAQARRAGQRGSSATQRMLADRALQLDAEQDSGGRSSVWREVYALMRCPGPPCNLGPHCWRDPFGKKHYKLRTHHLKALIELVQQGLVLSTHNDVPEEIRDQLYAEDHQRRERPASGSSASTPSLQPITINNVMPSPSPFQESPVLGSLSASSASHERLVGSVSLDISGPRDLAVMAYSDWQQSNVVDQAQKNEYQKACDLVLREMLDLEQVYEDQNPAFFIQGGVKSGVARRFVSDIARWAKDYKTTQRSDDIRVGSL